MRITLPSGTPAELAQPAGGVEPTRGLVVLPDIGGLRPLFDEMVQRLADENGWAVCTPEPFPGLEGQPLEWRLDHAGEVPDARRLQDAADAADATGCDRVAVLGFCMGGMFTLKAAGTGRFDRAVAFYGMIRTPEKWQSPGYVEPLDAVVAAGAAPAMLIAGTVDPWTPAEDLAALEAAGVAVVRYEGADHGFVHDPSRPSHRADDARDAWAHALAFITS